MVSRRTFPKEELKKPALQKILGYTYLGGRT